MLGRVKIDTLRYRCLARALWLIQVIILVGSQVVWTQPLALKPPPKTRTDNVKESIHGIEIVDPYRWLEDDKSSETQAWINAQNEYTQSIIGALPGRQALKRRLAELMNVETMGIPIVRNGRYFFSKKLPNDELLVVYLRRGISGKDEVLIDPHSMSSDRTTTVVVGHHLFIQTNWDAANGRIFDVDLNNPARTHWREIIPASDAVIQGFSLIGHMLFVNYLQNVHSRVKVFKPSGEFVREIEFPAIGTVGGVSGRWEDNEAFFAFSSFPIPPTIYRYDVPTGKQLVWSRLDIPFKSDQVEVKQVWYESKDQAKIPMFIMHAKGLKLDGSNPTLLTGYGGFNASRTPGFSLLAVLWAEHGGVYAIPNLRGGGEFGEAWHQAGMLEKKQNVFDDFVAATEWLIKNGYANPKRLAISGSSNGGLLVGAALTQRPELFQAIVCSIPLLDMVRYHKFLVGPLWISEYGSSDNPEQFKYLYAYSPYHHVKPDTKYPAVLFITGDADTRVDPLHARKMTALLQSATGSDKPVLLSYGKKFGHSGGRPFSQQIENLGDELSFLFWQLGIMIK